MKKAVWLSLVLGSAAFAQQQPAVVGKLAPGGATFFTWLSVVSVVAMAVAAIGVAFAQSIAARKALDGAARPAGSRRPKLMTQMLIAVVFMETLAIYALLVIFLMLFVNPFAKYFLL